MLLTQGFDPTAFPPSSWLTANLASTEGFQFCDFNAIPNGVIRMIDVEAQAAELLFYLQYFKRASGRRLELVHERFQLLAESPEDVRTSRRRGRSRKTSMCVERRPWC
jgi:hypothetical protein